MNIPLNRAIWLLGLLGVLGGIVALTSKTEASAIRLYSDGPRVALKEVTSADGRSVSFTVGRAVIVNFWATWCGPCNRELPDLQALYRRYLDDVVVVGVSVDPPEVDAASFASRLGVQFPILRDGNDFSTQFARPGAIPV